MADFDQIEPLKPHEGDYVSLAVLITVVSAIQIVSFPDSCYLWGRTRRYGSADIRRRGGVRDQGRRRRHAVKCARVLLQVQQAVSRRAPVAVGETASGLWFGVRGRLTHLFRRLQPLCTIFHNTYVPLRVLVHLEALNAPKVTLLCLICIAIVPHTFILVLTIIYFVCPCYTLERFLKFW